MKQADEQVDILDNEGNIVAQKPRRSIDKRVDIFNSVQVILVTPQRQALLSMIPQREDLPNVYAGLIGSTMATIRRHNETTLQAARRGLTEDLLIEAAELVLLCDGMVTLEDGRRMCLTGYSLVAERPGMYMKMHIGEIVQIDADGVDVAMALHSDRFSPTLKAIWPNLRPADSTR